jgi:hypothetical protein
MLVAIFIVVSLCNGSSAKVAIAGAGTKSCAEFGKIYKEMPEVADAVFTAWAQGYMSGQNIRSMADHRQTRNLPESSS